MKAIDIQTLTEFTGGKLIRGASMGMVTQVNTDSRTVSPGQVFFALSGDRFDAHHFIPQVIAAGAAAVIVSKVDPTWAPERCAIIRVADTLQALQNLAAAYRLHHAPKVLCVTGSNGKTSTKDLACAVLGTRFHVRATLGNFNNHIGVPLSILHLAEGDDYGVFELGMNHPGEIAPLAAIARPDGAIITNIGIAHIEYLGTQEAIALEKGMLAEAVPASGFVVLNANDRFTPSIRARTVAKVIEAGIGRGDVSATDLLATASGTHFTLNIAGDTAETFLPIPGQHMVGNAALAAAAAWQSGVCLNDIVTALANVKITKGRLETKIIHGITFLDDSYNANPDSMKAGLRTLAGLECKGRRVAVLGQMGELGEHVDSGHREVGVLAGELQLDAVFAIGEKPALIAEAASEGGISNTQTFSDHETCANHLQQWLLAGDLVLVKGSRSAAMERVIHLLQNK